MSSAWGPGIGIIGGGGGSGHDNTSLTEQITLSPTDIANQFVVLGNIPTVLGQVAVTIKNGPDQFYGLDFTMVAPQTLSWVGLPMSALVSTGDIISVEYPVTV